MQKDLKGLLDGIKVNEGIRLGDMIFIVHGHQVDFLCNDRLGRATSKYIVRNLWQPLQNIFGFKDPTSPAKNFKKRDTVENKIFNWAKQEKKLVIAGHTHRPMFYSLSKKDRIQRKEEKQEEPFYFNVGSCVHPRCITGIEIEGGFIRLVKWFNNVGTDGRLFIDKKVLEQENLRKILDRLSESG